MVAQDILRSVLRPPTQPRLPNSGPSSPTRSAFTLHNASFPETKRMPARTIYWMRFATAILACRCLSAQTTVPSRVDPVEFRNGDVVLRGSVTIPLTAGRHGAVVLLGGDSPWAGYGRYFATLSDAFTSAGFAVLRYDHRGDGASGGSYPAAFADLAADALAAVHLLQNRSDIDPRHVGIWGHSQGGWIGPLAASQSSDVAFVIIVSGSAVSVLETTLFRDGNRYRKRGVTEADIARISAIKRIVDRYYGTLSDYDFAKQALDSVRGEQWLELGNWPELTASHELYPPDVARARAKAFRFFVEARRCRTGRHDNGRPAFYLRAHRQS
jgi:pimeloyl-ACP methyl ester carboxylesterase